MPVRLNDLFQPILLGHKTEHVLPSQGGGAVETPVFLQVDLQPEAE
jgi:hypothetical protein